MKVERLETGFLAVNTYIVINEKQKSCVVIDPGGDYGRIMDRINSLNLKIAGVLLTHGHFDHIGACAKMQKDGCKIYLNYGDDGFTKYPRSAGFPEFSSFITPFQADVFVNDGDVLNLIGYKFKVLTTPGHTMGSVCYLVENCIFTGDTLFHMSVGRTDLEGGAFDLLLNSIKYKLLPLNNLTVYTGHGEMTDIDFEKKNNPYFQLVK